MKLEKQIMNIDLLKKLFSIFICALLFACSNDKYDDIILPKTRLLLKWNKSHANQTIGDATLGLAWCYSNLGATFLNSVVLPNSNNIITVEISQLGFNQHAIENLETLHQKIKESEEYQQTNAIDLGRYISLLIGASQHYYKITNVLLDLDEILSNYELSPNKGYVDNSTISLEHRVIEFSSQVGLNQLFISTEIDPVTSEIFEFETIEIMENGQLKFGLFDADGNRKNTGSPEHTLAGKPAKCMWCHESNINRLFTIQNDFTGYLTYLQLNDTLNQFNTQLKQKQLLLNDGVDFSQAQDHAQMELLYISFMEPSAQRLSLEWGLTLTEVQNKLRNNQTHTHNEFPFLGDLYDRNEIELFAPFTSLQVSTSVRESSTIEVNHFD